VVLLFSARFSFLAFFILLFAAVWCRLVSSGCGVCPPSGLAAVVSSSLVLFKEVTGFTHDDASFNA